MSILSADPFVSSPPIRFLSVASLRGDVRRSTFLSPSSLFFSCSTDETDLGSRYACLTIAPETDLNLFSQRWTTTFVLLFLTFVTSRVAASPLLFLCLISFLPILSPVDICSPPHICRSFFLRGAVPSAPPTVYFPLSVDLAFL